MSLQGSVFTPVYTYTPSGGFNVRIDTNLPGNVAIGDIGTNYDLLLNGLPLNNSGASSQWSLFPAVSTVNLCGNTLTDSATGVVTISGAIGGDSGMLGVLGNIGVGNGNVILTSGNLVLTAGNITVNGDEFVSGTLTVPADTTGNGAVIVRNVAGMSSTSFVDVQDGGSLFAIRRNASSAGDGTYFEFSKAGLSGDVLRITGELGANPTLTVDTSNRSVLVNGALTIQNICSATPYTSFFDQQQDGTSFYIARNASDAVSPNDGVFFEVVKGNLSGGVMRFTGVSGNNQTLIVDTCDQVVTVNGSNVTSQLKLQQTDGTENSQMAAFYLVGSNSSGYAGCNGVPYSFQTWVYPSNPSAKITTSIVALSDGVQLTETASGVYNLCAGEVVNLTKTYFNNPGVASISYSILGVDNKYAPGNVTDGTVAIPVTSNFVGTSVGNVVYSGITPASKTMYFNELPLNCGIGAGSFTYTEPYIQSLSQYVGVSLLWTKASLASYSTLTQLNATLSDFTAGAGQIVINCLSAGVPFIATFTYLSKVTPP